MTAALPLPLKRPSWRQRLLRLMPWHRRLALLACLGLFGWAFTGLLHPLMSALQPRPATMLPPQEALPVHHLMAPAQVLERADIGHVQTLRLMQLDGEPYYQARLPGASEPRYWHARSGEEAPLTARHAEHLARHYLGSDEPLHYAGSLDAFNGEYAFINRLLPAARVDSQREDGLRLYLDLYQDRLATLVDTRKAWFATLFQQVHSFRWLDAAGPLRPALMLVLLVAFIATTLLGVGLFLARRRAASPLRYLHGWAGLLLATTSLAFAGSGAWHLLHKENAAPAPEAFTAEFASRALRHAPSADWLKPGEQLLRLSLLQLDGQPIWRLQGSAGLRYLQLDGQELGADAGQRYAEQRFAHYAEQLGLGKPLSIEPQTQFDHDYGFIFKRLPVLKARYGDAQNTTLYIDPLDGALTARINDADRAEGWSFGYLHKWDFASGLGKTAKDALIGATALAHLLLAGVGLWLLRRKKRMY